MVKFVYADVKTPTCATQQIYHLCVAANEPTHQVGQSTVVAMRKGDRELMGVADANTTVLQ